MSKAKILVVEDESIVALDIQRRLTNLGYEVVSTAASGDEAVRKAEQLRPDLALMDIRIKGSIDGVEAAQQIRTRFDIPVVYVTAYADEPTLERAKITEPFGYLLKPFESERLRSTIDLALYRHGMERRLRDSEERFRTLIENASDIIAILDRRGAIRYVSPSVERVLGYKPAGLTDQNVYELIHSDDFTKLASLLMRNDHDQESSYRGEVRIRHSGGSWRILEVIGHSRLNDPAVEGIVINARDITHRKQAEQELQRYAEQLEALEQAAAIVSSTLDLDQVLDRILEQVERVVAGNTFNIMLIEKNVARLVRWRGYEDIDAQEGLASLSLPIDSYPNLRKMAQTGTPIVVPDTAVDPNWISSENRDWLRSYVATPIRVGDHTVGFLNVNGTQPGQFGTADAHRLEAFASHAATAIENAQLHQELRAYADRLEDLVHERTAQLQTQYARLDAILDSTSDGIVVADDDGEIIQTNPVAQKWLAQALSREDSARLRDTIRELAAQLDRHSVQLLELTGLDLELKAAPILKPGAAEGTVVVDIHDVSHLKALDRMKTVFVANASDELRQPVTTIKTYAYLMKQMPPEDERWTEYLDALTQETDRQIQLVDEILQISRIYTERLAMEPRPTALDDLAKIVVTNRQSLALARGVSLEHVAETVVSPSDLTVLADPQLMTRVLNYLVEGALQYTPEGGRVVISTGTKQAQGRTWATVTVSDTGETIPAQDLPHVFERFFREREPRSVRISKTGLRLMIVKGVVELHGGRVVVQSPSQDPALETEAETETDGAGQGATFIVQLPITVPGTSSLPNGSQNGKD